MRSRITAVAAAVVPLVLALAPTACVRTAASAAARNDADSTAVPVVAHTAGLSTRAWSTTASGIVHANATVDVAFQVPGKVVAVGPDEGQPVRAGQALAALDATEYQ